MLGIREGMRVWIGGHDLAARRVVESRLPPVAFPPTGAIDVAVITPQSVDEAVYFASKLKPRLVPDAKLWVLATTKINSADSSEWNEESVNVQLAAAGFVPLRTDLLDDQTRAMGYRLE